MKNKKGISPLIATVILIAATMSIAGILAFWTSGFVRTELEQSAGITGGAECISAKFDLHSGSYKDGNLNLILDNKKAVDLFLKDLYLIYPNNNVVPVSLNQTLKGNEIKLVTVPDVDSGFLTGEIKTHCPDVSLFFTYDQVSE